MPWPSQEQASREGPGCCRGPLPRGWRLLALFLSLLCSLPLCAAGRPSAGTLSTRCSPRGRRRSPPRRGTEPAAAGAKPVRPAREARSARPGAASRARTREQRLSGSLLPGAAPPPGDQLRLLLTFAPGRRGGVTTGEAGPDAVPPGFEPFSLERTALLPPHVPLSRSDSRARSRPFTSSSPREEALTPPRKPAYPYLTLC